jgi:pyrroline-5-carboxylate reductase
MGAALLKGWVRDGLSPIVAVEPQPSAVVRKFAAANRIALLGEIDEAIHLRPKACVIALKPQILKTEAERLRPIADSGALMLSIAAGTGIATLRRAWGRKAIIVRAMPNTPGAIGRGICALYAPKGTSPGNRRRAAQLLAGLGTTLWVKIETLIDAVTAVSGSGPAYVFLFVESLAAAAVAEGLPRDIAERLACETVAGAGALLLADKGAPAELRRDVTSPGGTTEAALRVLMQDDALARLLARAVSAARLRAAELRG